VKTGSYARKWVQVVENECQSAKTAVAGQNPMKTVGNGCCMMEMCAGE